MTAELAVRRMACLFPESPQVSSEPHQWVIVFIQRAFRPHHRRSLPL
ncbi:hypothetical protein [Phytohabitans suffuscus]